MNGDSTWFSEFVFYTAISPLNVSWIWFASDLQAAFDTATLLETQWYKNASSSNLRVLSSSALCFLYWVRTPAPYGPCERMSFKLRNSVEQGTDGIGALAHWIECGFCVFMPSALFDCCALIGSIRTAFACTCWRMVWIHWDHWKWNSTCMPCEMFVFLNILVAIRSGMCLRTPT